MHTNATALIPCVFLIGGFVIGSAVTGSKKNEIISRLRSEKTTLDAGMKELLSERVRVARKVLAPESFHLIEPGASSIQFSGYEGELLWFTGDNGISYPQLNPENDPGIRVSEGKPVSRPPNATAFMLKGKSENGWKMTFATK